MDNKLEVVERLIDYAINAVKEDAPINYNMVQARTNIATALALLEIAKSLRILASAVHVVGINSECEYNVLAVDENSKYL
jgi:hypothetical protein